MREIKRQVESIRRQVNRDMSIMLNENEHKIKGYMEEQRKESAREMAETKEKIEKLIEMIQNKK